MGRGKNLRKDKAAPVKGVRSGKSMNEFNIFEAFGLSDDDFFGDTPKKEEKKAPAKKAEGKKEEKKAPAAKPAPDFDVKMPVTVKARGFAQEVKIGDGATAKASAVWEALCKEHPELAIDGFRLVYAQELGAAFVTDGKVSAADDKTAAFPNAGGAGDEDEDGEAGSGENKIVVSDGGIRCELTPEDFGGMDAEDVTLGDVRDRFVAANPDYKGCRLSFNDEAGVAYPTFTRYVAPKEGEIVDVIVNGTRQSIEHSKDSTVCDKACGKIPGVSPYVMEGGVAFLCYREGNAKEAKVYGKGGAAGSAGGSKAKTVEKKYPLPMTLLVTNFNVTYELTEQMFPGKEKVTHDEITKAMAGIEPLFGDSDRKVEYLYSESKKLMSCMFISGKKG